MTTLSVIICTRNLRPAYMQRTLESLDRQTLAKEHWELLIVDNASDNKVADQWDLSWHPRVRHVREDVVGVLSARLRGIAEFSGDLCVFFDDDTVVDPSFLEKVLALSASHPYLGALGCGMVDAEFDVTPPTEVMTYMRMLGIRALDSPRWTNNPEDPSCRPGGAGLCITRQVAREYQRLTKDICATDVIGRRGERLFSGEDDLFSWAASTASTGVGLFPELRLTHLISSERTTRDYFIRLNHDHTFSHSVLSYMLTGRKPKEFNVLKSLRILANGLKNGKFSMQCLHAQARGEAAAAELIKQRRLRPIEGFLKTASVLLVAVIQASPWQWFISRFV